MQLLQTRKNFPSPPPSKPGRQFSLVSELLTWPLKLHLLTCQSNKNSVSTTLSRYTSTRTSEKPPHLRGFSKFSCFHPQFLIFRLCAVLRVMERQLVREEDIKDRRTCTETAAEHEGDRRNKTFMNSSSMVSWIPTREKQTITSDSFQPLLPHSDTCRLPAPT